MDMCRSREPLFISCVVGEGVICFSPEVSSFKKTAPDQKDQFLESCLARVEGPLVGFSSACGSSSRGVSQKANVRGVQTEDSRHVQTPSWKKKMFPHFSGSLT